MGLIPVLWRECAGLVDRWACSFAAACSGFGLEMAADAPLLVPFVVDLSMECSWQRGIRSLALAVQIGRGVQWGYGTALGVG